VAIAAHFDASGVRPTAPDRERLASGIELSEHLAAAVSCLSIVHCNAIGSAVVD